MLMVSRTQAILYNFKELLPSFRRWESEGKADTEFLRQEFGSMAVPVRSKLECLWSSFVVESKFWPFVNHGTSME